MAVGSLVHSRLAGPGSRRDHFDIPTYPPHRVRAAGRFAVAKTRPYSILAPRAAGWSFFQWTLCVSILACAALGNLTCYICRAFRWSFTNGIAACPLSDTPRATRHVEEDWTVFFLCHRDMRRPGSSRLHAMCVEIEQQPQSGIRFAMAFPPPGTLHGVDSP